MAVRSAWVEEEGQGRMIEEQALARDELVRRGVPVETFQLKRLQRRAVPLDAETLVVGTIRAVLAALHQLGVAEPPPLDYPDSLRGFLARRVWPATVREVATGLRSGAVGPVFIKPRSRQKLFTGFVATDRGALGHVEAWGMATPVWCSDVVAWGAEWRVFVCGQRVLDVRRYTEEDEAIDLRVVEAAIAAWRAAGTMPAACAVDFGILADGRTALVEVNDAFALGAYGLSGAHYVDMLIARWTELTTSAR